MLLLHKVEEHDKWLKRREGLYTGSNALKFLTAAGQKRINRGIVTQYAQAEMSTWGGNYYTRRGHTLEAEAIALFEQIHPEYVLMRPKIGFVENTKYAGCGYSPDDIGVTITVEVKAFKEEKHLAINAKNVPAEILAQVQFGQVICERNLTALLLYNPDLAAEQALKIIWVKRRPSTHANIKRLIRG